MVFWEHYLGYLIQIKSLTSGSFQICVLVVPDRSNTFDQNEHFFQKFEALLELEREQKESFQTILGTIFWNFTIFQYISNSLKVKGILVSSAANLVHELLHELPNNLSLRILGEKEISRKCQIQVDKQPSGQSLLKKLDFGNSS